MASFIDIHIGKRIRTLREKNRIAPSSIGDALDLSDAELQDIEGGTRRLQADEMIELCGALGIDPEDLYEGLHLGGGTVPQPVNPLGDFLDRRKIARSAR